MPHEHVSHLRVSPGCKCARGISDGLKWGKHVGGTHDDMMSVQKMSVIHHTRDDDLRTDIHHEAHRKIPEHGTVNLKREVKKYNTG